MSSMYEGRRLGLEELLSTETGREFVHDEKAWRLLHGRLADARDQSMLWTKPMSEPPEWRAKFDVYPREMHFAPNGRSIAYVSRDDRAIFPHEKWKEADGMAIEEIDSGRKVAFLAGVRNRFQISPAGDLAIQNIYNRDGGRDEQPALALWDISTSSPRGCLFMPNTTQKSLFSQDGRIVFAASGPDHGKICWATLVRWWNTSDGRQLGEAGIWNDWHLLHDDRQLVSRSNDMFAFWDVASGQKIGEWDIGDRASDLFKVSRIVWSQNRRYFLAEFEKDRTGASTQTIKYLDDAEDWMSRMVISRIDTRLPARLVVLDMLTRRESGHVPGYTGAISDNGEWLATIDEEGTIRVWRMPLAKPWTRSFGYALAIVLGACSMFRFIRWLRTRGALRA